MSLITIDEQFFESRGENSDGVLQYKTKQTKQWFHF
jgi:hypothetical protein